MLLVIGAIGFDAISGVLEDINIDLDEVLETDPGPKASEVEDALVGYGEQVGLAIEADCPESSQGG